MTKISFKKYTETLKGSPAALQIKRNTTSHFFNGNTLFSPNEVSP